MLPDPPIMPMPPLVPSLSAIAVKALSSRVARQKKTLPVAPCVIIFTQVLDECGEHDVLEGVFPATAMPDPDWWQALWPRPGEVLTEFGIETGAEAVDLCCGDGLFTVPLARMARHVIAIDLDPKMVELARVRAATAGVTNCVFIIGDAYDLAELVPGCVDFVLIANTWYPR